MVGEEEETREARGGSCRLTTRRNGGSKRPTALG